MVEVRQHALVASILVSGCWVTMSWGCTSDGGDTPVAGGGAMTSAAATYAGAGLTQVGGATMDPTAGQSGGVAQSGAAASAGLSPNAGAAGLAVGGAGGATTAGAGSSAGGGHGGSTAGGTTSGSGNAERCAEIETEYAIALEEQISCSPNGQNQCGSSAEAAPGCDCQVFIQPKDPFAIEALLNLQFDWFDADCSDPDCPADCSSGSQGTCAANGRCTAP